MANIIEKYSILLTHEDPVLGKHIRGHAPQESTSKKSTKLSTTVKTLPHLLRIIQVTVGVYRCTTSDHTEWLVINVDNF